MTAQTPMPPAPEAEAARTPLVEMRDISVSFGGVQAVRSVTIDLHAGEVVGIVGGNGAGKSTLMKVLSGAQSADSGEIRVNREPAACSLASMPGFPDGPSALTFGRGKRGFDRRNLYVVNFAGEVIELPGVRGPRHKRRG